MRSAILLFPAKRANRAMLTSTMRLVFETTIERRPEPRQPMPLARVVPLDAMRLVFARMELSDRQEHVIDHVIVGAVQARAPACSATIWMRGCIASPEMFPNVDPLPHLKCSRPGWGRGDSD